MVVDSFKSAETTAKWEIELSDIANCKKIKEIFEKLRKNKNYDKTLQIRSF